VASRGTRLRDLTGSVRFRTTGAAVLVVGLALLITGAALASFLQRSLRSQERTSALLRANAVADALRKGQDPDAVLLGDPDEEFIQVLDANGDVVLSSTNVEGEPPMTILRPGQERAIQVPFEDPTFLVVARSAGTDEGTLTVMSGRSLERLTETGSALAVTLVVALPILLSVFAVIIWFVVGRALAPVEAIREEVDEITSSRLDRRVPDPPGDDEIARLAATMNRMLERLEAGQLRQRRFVSDASHELRSPVTTIREHAELALSHPDEITKGELAEVVLEEDVRLQALVEDLLLLTRVDEGTLELRTEPVDVDDLLFEEAARLRSSTDLRVDISSVTAARMVGDRPKLERLVRNLTDNAARHAASTIRLAVREDDGRVVLHVDDDGPGVPGPLRSVIFERFARLDESRDREGGGTGLGLAIVEEIAQAHGGTATVSDAPLGGARFEVLMPSGAPDG
jgi:signal transduction histidine kinase